MRWRPGISCLLSIFIFATVSLAEEAQTPKRTTTAPWTPTGKIQKQFRGFGTPRPPGIQPADGDNVLYASVWATWTGWSFCSNGVRMRVRACNTVRGFSCLGRNQEIQPCDAFDPNFGDGRKRIDDYDVVDPWAQDREEAMKQLYDEEPTTPPPPGSNELKRRMAGVKTRKKRQSPASLEADLLEDIEFAEGAQKRYRNLRKQNYRTQRTLEPLKTIPSKREIPQATEALDNEAIQAFSSRVTVVGAKSRTPRKIDRESETLHLTPTVKFRRKLVRRFQKLRAAPIDINVETVPGPEMISEDFKAINVSFSNLDNHFEGLRTTVRPKQGGNQNFKVISEAERGYETIRDDDEENSGIITEDVAE
ncbi:unnamed protein product, partial [Mesorhabditis spiculigera]